MTVFKRNVHLGTSDPLVETDDIADKAVTTEKLADSAVTSEKIADGSVTLAKLASAEMPFIEYTDEKVAEEATARVAADAELASLIELERSDRDAEEILIRGDISDIQALIPSQATSANQLADKAFVNSSIATSTATFKGTYNNLAELQEIDDADENDYGFVVATDADGNTIYRRYKYVGGEWIFEYNLNNSSFTAVQWETINSGISAADVEKLSLVGTAIDDYAISSYIDDETHLLPRTSAYTYQNIPIAPFRINDDDEGISASTERHYMIFPIRTRLKSAFVDEDDNPVYTEKTHFFVFKDVDEGFVYTAEWSELPAWVKRRLSEDIPTATSSQKGLMSSTDKEKLEELPTSSEIGDIDELDTSASSLVSAINETYGSVRNVVLRYGYHEAILETTTVFAERELDEDDYVEYWSGSGYILYARTLAASAAPPNDSILKVQIHGNTPITLTVCQIGDIEALADTIGDLSELDTTSKDNLVSAMNELNSVVENLEGAFSGTSPIDEFSETTVYGTGDNDVRYCYNGGLLYRAIATHVGAWDSGNFEQLSVIDLIEIFQNIVIGNNTVSGFDETKEYTAGDPVVYNNKFYLFTSGHVGAWDDADVEETSFFEWLQSLYETISTYIGNGKEQVVVTCSTDVENVSMEGLTLYVYLNGSTTEAEEYTTDSHGMATFRIPVGYTYRIVFPDVANVVSPSPVTHTASVAQRSVEAEYSAIPAEQTETLTINFQKWGENSSNYEAYQGEATITIDGTATTYTADTDGSITVEIPIGTAYEVDITKPDDLHIMGGSYHQELTAEQTSRVLVVRMSEYLSGILLTDAAGNDYTFDQFQELVTAGTLTKADAKFIHLCTNALLTNAVAEGTDSTCYVSVYEIANRKYHDTDGNFSNAQWCNYNIQFSSIPNNTYQYDGKYRTAQIIAEGAERGYTTPAATRCNGMSYTLEDSSATVLQGFLAARGQWDALWSNRTYIDEMLDYLYDGEDYYTLSSYTTNKWSSDQNGLGAYSLNVAWGNNNKTSQYAVVPFYA